MEMETPSADERLEDLSILIIEDDHFERALMQEIIATQPGWYCRTAENLEEGVAILQENHWNLVILDLNLPDSRGIATLHRILEISPDTGVVIMSGDSQESVIKKALRAGAQDYIIKGPVSALTFIHIIRNATERNHLRMQANDAHNLLASTLDTLPNYIALMETDGVIRATNSRWAHYANQGNPLIHGCKEGTNYLAACDRAKGDGGGISSVAVGILKVMAGIMDRFTEDYSVPAYTGRSWFELNATRFNDRQGKTTVVISQTDISDRKMLEIRLRSSEDLFSIISNNVVDLMAIIDIHGLRVYTSPSYSAVLGYSEQETKDIDLSSLLHPEDLDKVSASLKALFSGHSTNQVDYRLRHKNGEYLFFESRGRFIPPKGSEPAKALVVARDVTERHKAEQEKVQMEGRLRQAQKLEAIGQLAAGIAHEINTPTQYIGDNTIFLRDSVNDLCQFADLVADSLDQPPSNTTLTLFKDKLQAIDVDYLKKEIPRAIQQTMEGVSRVSKIVSAMKDFSHPSGDVKESIDLNRAIESTITISRNEWKYVAEMELTLGESLPLVPCFPGELNQVILNLIVNAAHAIDEARKKAGTEQLGKITISTRQVNDNIEIRIKDTGIGIPEAIRERVFDLFFTTKPVGKGTGQGLSLAHAVIVEKHGGHLSFESLVGQGTTFIIELPL